MLALVNLFIHVMACIYFRVWERTMAGREKPLSETNPYLRDPKLRKKMMLVAAASQAPLIMLAPAFFPQGEPSGLLPASGEVARVEPANPRGVVNHRGFAYWNKWLPGTCYIRTFCGPWSLRKSGSVCRSYGASDDAKEAGPSEEAHICQYFRTSNPDNWPNTGSGMSHRVL